ncbi:unnamed protein product [Closterium sp. NIES-53]
MGIWLRPCRRSNVENTNAPASWSEISSGMGVGTFCNSATSSSLKASPNSHTFCWLAPPFYSFHIIPDSAPSANIFQRLYLDSGSAPAPAAPRVSPLLSRSPAPLSPPASAALSPPPPSRNPLASSRPRRALGGRLTSGSAGPRTFPWVPLLLPRGTPNAALVGARSPVASLSSPPAPPPFPWPVPPLWGGGGGGGGGDGRGGAGKGGVHGGSARGIGGHVQQLPRLPDNPTPQQLREWVVQRVSLGGSGRCLNVRRTGKLKGQPCGKLHTEYRFFGCLEDAWVDEYGNEVIVPNWLKLQGMGVDVYALDFVQINKAIYAMYVTELSDEGACYSCVPGDAGVAAAALGAIESVAALGASESSVAGASESSASAEALHTFTLDSGASRCFFRDCTTLTPLAALVAVSLADPTGGPVVARASTVLLCPAVPSGSLSGLHLPTLSTNLVSNAALHDVWVDTFTPRGQRVAICQVTASSQVSASGQLAVPCSCWVLSHQTLLWHHRLDHPSLPRLRSMHSRLLVSGLPRSLPSLLRLPAPPCLPCVEGRQRAAPHSSEFPLTTAPLQTLHMDVWGPAPVGGMDQERYFLLVVDDYTRYTNVVPLRRKADVIGVLIPWIRATIRQLRDRFSRDLPLLRLHSDRGGEFSSNLLADFCRDEGIVQSFTLLASPQQNGIADRCIGLILEVARTSIIHAAAPHYLWPFVVRYAAHQLNLWPCVSLPETSPTLRWTGQSKLSPRTLRSVFLGFPTDAPLWQFYHLSSCRVFSSQDVTFEESVCYYRLHPHASHPVPLAPLFQVPVPPPVDPLPPQGPAPSGVSQIDLAPLAEGEGFGGAATGGAGSGGAEIGGADSGGAASPGGGGGSSHAGAGATSPGGAGDTAGGTRGASGAGGTGAVSPGGSGAADGGAAGPGGLASAGGAGGAAGPGGTRGATGARGIGAAGAVGASDAGAGGAGGAGGTAGAGGSRGATGAGGTGATSPTGPRGAGGAGGTTGAGGIGAAGAGGIGAAGAGGAGAFAGAGGARATTTSGTGGPGPAGVLSHLLALPPAPTEFPTRASVRAHVPRVCHSRAPAVPGTHHMTLRPSSVPLRVVLPSPPKSSLPAGADPASDLARASSLTVTRFLATVVMDSTLSSPAASALVAEPVDFAAAYHLDYRASLVSDPGPACPPSVGGEVALGCDVLKDRHEELDCLAAAAPHLATMLLAHEGDPNALDIPTPRSYKEANSGEYSSQWQIAMDAEMASWTSTGTYVDEDPPPGVNIISGMWIFRRDYELYSLDFSIAFLRGSPHEEIWLRHPPGFTRSFPEGTQWSLLRPVYGLRQAPREWHDTLRTTLAALWFAPSSANLSLFLRTDTTLSPFFVLVYVDDLVFATADTEALALVKAELQERHTCTGLDPSALRLPVVLATAHSSVYRPLTLSSTFGRVRRAEWSVPRACGLPHVHWDAAKRVLHNLCSTLGMRLVLGGRGSVVLTGYYDASWADDQATQRSSQGNTFSLGSGSISWRSTHSSFVLGSSCEAEIYAGAMVAQELRWLTYMLTDVGERPRSPPVLYVHNKAMLALCHEQRLEHRTNHIALHYFLVRELQQRRQLCLSYVASRANTADVFTKAFGSGDHQRFCTALGLVPTLPHLLVA